jgi:hypothetical protein
MELLTRGERILLVVDTHSEMNSSWDDKRSRLQALKEGECPQISQNMHTSLLLTVVVGCCCCSSDHLCAKKTEFSDESRVRSCNLRPSRDCRGSNSYG